MNEKLLQYIWDRQLFNTHLLQTTRKERVEVMDTGRWNMDQGPDFLGAKVRVDGRLWAGHVELHINSSDWEAHGHQFDHNYDNVILHVVWKDDMKMIQELPVVELHPLVPSYILKKYSDWMWRQSLVPCGDELKNLPAEMIHPFLEWMTRERFIKRADEVMVKVKAVGMDWQEAFWRAMARSFGYKVNADAFESIAASLPYNILLKLRSQVFQLEALLLGQAGLLRPDTGDEYAKQLFSEYGFLKKKYKLSKSYVPVHFLRMRPSNFPTIRLAQLAMLVHRVPELFRMVKEMRDPVLLFDMLKVEASTYWDTHYRFAESSVNQKKQTGDQLIGNLVVNTLVPFIVAYNMHIGNQRQADLTLEWLTQMVAEQNAIIREFQRHGLKARDMRDAQGLLELHKNFCARSRCAECAIGRWHLASRSGKPLNASGQSANPYNSVPFNACHQTPNEGRGTG